METKKNIFKEHLSSWLKADKKGRGRIIDMICAVASVHHKSVPRSFRRLQMRTSGGIEKRGRRKEYGPDVDAALKTVSEAASHPCGENLHALIPEYVRMLKRDGLWKHGEEATGKLLEMSVATAKRKAAVWKRFRSMMRGKSATRPGSIKAMIPVRSGPWDEAAAGTVQIDTVAHCGDTLLGDFIYTVNAVDVRTLWSGRRAQWNKGQAQTIVSMDKIDANFFFPVLEWHPDSGSEFINWSCKDWCERRGQKISRSRPSRKNDNCFVEERNGHVVRRWIGYLRFDAPELVEGINEVYDVLTPYLNHFAASRRIIAKERFGAKWKIKREKASLTPYERVMARADISAEAKERIMAEHERLNPLLLKREIDRRINKLFLKYRRLSEPKS